MGSVAILERTGLANESAYTSNRIKRDYNDDEFDRSSEVVATSAGTTHENVTPGPGFGVAHKRPPRASKMETLIRRPMPMPCGFVV
jgi:hypothetical protein